MSCVQPDFDLADDDVGEAEAHKIFVRKKSSVKFMTLLRGKIDKAYLCGSLHGMLTNLFY